MHKLLTFLIALAVTVGAAASSFGQGIGVSGFQPSWSRSGGGASATLTDTGQHVAGCFVGCGATLNTSSAGSVVAVAISIGGVNITVPSYSVTIDTHPMTCFDSTFATTQTAVVCYLAYVPSTTASVALTMGGASPNANDVWFTAYSLSGVTSTPTTSANHTANNNSEPETLSIAIPTSGLAIEVLTYDRAVPSPVWTNTTCPTNCTSFGTGGSINSGVSTTAGSTTIGFSGGFINPGNAEVAVAWGP